MKGAVKSVRPHPSHRREQPDTRDVVLDVVLETLVSQGYDAVRVRDVSRRSRVSSKTIYELFDTRRGMIAAALERWMAANVYVNVDVAQPHESLYDVHMRFVRALFEPWERNPRMLEAYHRAQLGPEGEQLREQGTTAARRVGETLLIEDADFARDLEEIMRNVSDGLISRFVHGEIEVTEIVPRLEIAVSRLTRAHAARA